MARASGDCARAATSRRCTRPLRPACHGWEHVFFRTEYRLNARIARYGKPYVALMDGLVMGGGIGVSAHGSWRIVTGVRGSRCRRRASAVPRCRRHLPAFAGAGRTRHPPRDDGRQIGAADAILCGLPMPTCDPRSSPPWSPPCMKCRGGGRSGLHLALRRGAAPGRLAGARAWIDACYAHDEAETILAALSAHAGSRRRGRRRRRWRGSRPPR